MKLVVVVKRLCQLRVNLEQLKGLQNYAFDCMVVFSIWAEISRQLHVCAFSAHLTGIEVSPSFVDARLE